MKGGDRAWRVGHVSAPYRPAPREAASLSGRFDDPSRRELTLYVAAEATTALREALAPLRPDPDFVAEWQAEFGLTPPAQPLGPEWRKSRVLVAGTVVTAGRPIIDALDDRHLHRALEVTHAPLLAELGLRRVDRGVVSGPKRELTQSLRPALAAGGHAGIGYDSSLDGRPCAALFWEAAGFVDPPHGGDRQPLRDDLPELIAVCGELGIPLA